MTIFDVYCRISDEGDRTKKEVAEQLAVYEGACREWAERSGFEIGEVVHETNVSGATAVAERKLEPLLARIETGDSSGILTPYLDRFGRDQIEGCLAWRRITLAGGRLVCVNDGLDSDQPGAKLNFQIRMAIAEDYLDRVRANFQSRIKAAAKGGAYLACQPPVGYVRDQETSRIHPDPALKPLIQEAFRRRAEGETAKALAAWLREVGGHIEVPNPKKERNRKPDDPKTVKPLAGITEPGVRHMLASKAYLGIATVQSGRKGEPDEIQSAHEPIITRDLWERAQAAGGPYRPNDGSLASQAQLSGLVYCPNGHRLKVGGRGKNGKARAAYVCTHEECDARVAIAAAALDGYVLSLLSWAFLAYEPHVVAIMEGDDRYQRALEAVEAAQAEVDTWRRDVRITDMGGVEAWKDGLAARQTALDLARQELKATPPPAPVKRSGKRGKPVTFEEALPGLEREHNARFIHRVVVKPVGRGKQVPVGERCDVYFVGAEEPADMASLTPTKTVDIVQVDPALANTSA